MQTNWSFILNAGDEGAGTGAVMLLDAASGTVLRSMMLGAHVHLDDRYTSLWATT